MERVPGYNNKNGTELQTLEKKNTRNKSREHKAAA
jgi:hypothetical protein